MLQTQTTRLFITAALLALGASSASAAIVTRTFTVSTADIVDLYSATFDAPLTPCPGVNPPQECTFFGGTTPVARAIVITPTGTGTGTIDVNYNTVTGEITQVNEMLINLPTLSLVINGTTIVSVIPGNNAPTTSPQDIPFIEAGIGTLGRDLDGIYAQTLLGQGTPDPDQGVAIGQAPIFQHNDSPNPDAPDFSVFTDIVDSCTGPLCALITSGLLTLDGIRYRLEGTIGCKAGGSTLVLKAQTVNNSIYRVNFTTTTADTDCDLDGVLNNAPDNCPDEANAGQADTDVDGRGNVCDNCSAVANNTGAGAQADSDGDGFGNRCDGDLNGNLVTNSQDYVLFRAQLGAPSIAPVFNKADINANAVVNSQDYVLFRGLLGAPPGPGAGP